MKTPLNYLEDEDSLFSEEKIQRLQKEHNESVKKGEQVLPEIKENKNIILVKNDEFDNTIDNLNESAENLEKTIGILQLKQMEETDSLDTENDMVQIVRKFQKALKELEEIIENKTNLQEIKERELSEIAKNYSDSLENAQTEINKLIEQNKQQK